MQPRTSVGAGMVLCLALAAAVLAASRPANAPMIGKAYYMCESPRLLEGGIYGKGPFRRFVAEKDRDCPEWKAISKAKFKTLAVEWFGHNWKGDLVFWETE